jgi:sigma-E factor negative regulatory protein RseC
VIEETARVMETSGGFAWVEVETKSGCGTCAASGGCGSASIARLFHHSPTRLKVVNSVGARLGDEVIVGIEESALLGGALAVYMLPLVLLIVGAAIGEWLAQSWSAGSWSAGSWSAGHAQLISIALGLAGFASALAWVRRLGSRMAGDSRYQPVVLRRTHSAFP